ncbi:hypothetical protein FE783_24685 [Paenibacillus mesophilus]|uniref:hypothetical protein n=1 Tax=Paenibacillus mesophilus TaxID=2582849 RepID=UPI00110F2FAC|nr:hypothetical protein [Paenibacillus mesophilus]TMV46839.1 hypothetical protein FE783_24685 [Paenibacillus mesophilus]
MKSFVSILLVTGLVFLGIVMFLWYQIFDNEIGPFDVNDISATESDIQIATDLTIGKGTRLMKTVTEEGQIYALFEVHPYEGEIGIATFLPKSKKDRYKFDSASHSKNVIQAKTLLASGNEGVVIGVRRGASLHKLVVKRAHETIEKIVTKEPDFLEIVRFKSSLAADEITIFGYDELGQERAKTTIVRQSRSKKQ